MTCAVSLCLNFRITLVICAPFRLMASFEFPANCELLPSCGQDHKRANILKIEYLVYVSSSMFYFSHVPGHA